MLSDFSSQNIMQEVFVDYQVVAITIRPDHERDYGCVKDTQASSL